MENLESQNGNQNVVNEIMAIRQEIGMMGANDYEIPAVDQIIEKFEKGEYTPEEALQEVNAIKNRKADYH